MRTDYCDIVMICILFVKTEESHELFFAFQDGGGERGLDPGKDHTHARIRVVAATHTSRTHSLAVLFY